MSEKIKIEKNTVAETLVMPLYGRADCSKKYPAVFKDGEAESSFILRRKKSACFLSLLLKNSPMEESALTR